MRAIWTITRKELVSYLTTPWAWVVFSVTAAIASAFFVISLVDFDDFHRQVQESTNGWRDVAPGELYMRNLTDGVVGVLWQKLLALTLFVAPFLSMRLFAEERKNKTFELLMTAPVRPIEIVLGKFFGALCIIGCTIGLSIIYPLILSLVGSSQSGHTLEWSTVLMGYGALLLWGATNMAIGMFVSAMTESQMVAALVSFGIALGWMLLSGLGATVPEPARSLLNYLSFDVQLEPLVKGVLDLKPLVFFGSVIAFFVLLTHRAIEAQRWTP
ncbi:MAG: ABC transporter permease [Myxococcaceae bacterium]